MVSIGSPWNVRLAGGDDMRAIYQSPFKEENGRQCNTYGFTYEELRQIDYALDELVSYWNMWSEDDRKDVREDALKQIDMIAELGHKIDFYKNRALAIRDEEE